MAKKRINAKQAVDDIRTGMDDASLMTKYGLAPDGLQSLFDKLVVGGYMDLAEIQGRIPGFVGTVVIAESDLSLPNESKREALPSIKDKPSRVINAQEVVREIRAGTDDFALMTKFGLSSKALQSLYNKLVAAGSITQADLYRRQLGFEHTVVLGEDMMSLSQALNLMFADPISSTPEAPPQPEPAKAGHTPNGGAEKGGTPPENRLETTSKEAQRNIESYGAVWYDRVSVVILLMLVFFPLGFYGLYRNSRLSGQNKVLVAALWAVMVVFCATVFSGNLRI